MRLPFFICLLISFGPFSQRVENQEVIQAWKETAADKALSSDERKSAYLSIIHKAKNQPDSVVVDAYRQLAQLSRSEYDYVAGIAYCDTTLERFPKLDFLERQNIALDRAKVLKDKGDNTKAMSEYLRILREFEENGCILESAKLHSRIAIIFKKTDRLDSAIDHLEDAIALSKKINNTEQEASSLLTLGNCYKAKKDFDAAEEKYLASIAIAKENNYQRTLAGNYNGMGSLMRMLGNLDEAMTYYKKAVVINKESGNDQWLSYNYNNIGNILKGQNRVNEALEYFKLSLEMKERINDQRGKVLTLLNISDCYAELGDFKSAFANRRDYIELNDSLKKVDQAEETQKLSAEYHSEKREAQIAQLSIQDELNKQKIKASP